MWRERERNACSENILESVVWVQLFAKWPCLFDYDFSSQLLLDLSSRYGGPLAIHLGFMITVTCQPSSALLLLKLDRSFNKTFLGVPFNNSILSCFMIRSSSRSFFFTLGTRDSRMMLVVKRHCWATHAVLLDWHKADDTGVMAGRAVAQNHYNIYTPPSLYKNLIC